MNAYELSDELQNAKSISEIARLVKEQTIPMLRQLQDDLSDLQRHIPIKDLTNTLTDEEIIEVWNAFERTDNIPIVDFARAILRKAQEK